MSPCCNLKYCIILGYLNFKTSHVASWVHKSPSLPLIKYPGSRSLINVCHEMIRSYKIWLVRGGFVSTRFDKFVNLGGKFEKRKWAVCWDDLIIFHSQFISVQTFVWEQERESSGDSNDRVWWEPTAGSSRIPPAIQRRNPRKQGSARRSALQIRSVSRDPSGTRRSGPRWVEDDSSFVGLLIRHFALSSRVVGL